MSHFDLFRPMPRYKPMPTFEALRKNSKPRRKRATLPPCKRRYPAIAGVGSQPSPSKPVKRLARLRLSALPRENKYLKFGTLPAPS